MFTQTAPAPPATGLPSSPTRRLRGFSYLRNYTHTHLLSRDSSSSTSSRNNAASQHEQQQPEPLRSPTSRRSTFRSLTRSSSLSPNRSRAASPPSQNDPGRSNRLSLILASSHYPVSLTPASQGSRRGTPATTPTGSGRRSPTDEASVIPPIVTTGPVLEALEETDAASERTDHAATAEQVESEGIDVEENSMTRTRSATTNDAASGTGITGENLPSIRFSTFYDLRAPRPSLSFTPVSRTLPTGSEVIRVGRYSERDSQPNVPPNVPSAAPVGFKSKVVSRRHCEFWYEGGKWYIRDVKSSSGTFLNHIRLSPPGTESKPFAVNDGDIVQLGIDFKGGEEMIFRCVKMRLELNRGWQNKLNTFNMATHKRLRNMTSSSGNDGSGQSYSQDCSICLNRIAPCQCLFVAPCSHTWHYKCIRALLASPQYPIFQCPNCRAAADLEADIEDPEEWGELLDSEEEDIALGTASLTPRANADGSAAQIVPRKSRESTRSVRKIQPDGPPAQPAEDEPSGDVTMMLSPPTQIASRADLGASLSRPMGSRATSNPVPIPSTSTALLYRPSTESLDGSGHGMRTPSPPGLPVLNGPEGPITPRNDVGPWVFDGSDVRVRAEGGGVRITSLEAAVAGADADMHDAS